MSHCGSSGLTNEGTQATAKGENAATLPRATASVARQQTVCNTGVPERYRQHGLQTPLSPVWSDNRPYVTLEFPNAIDNMVYRPLYRQCGQTTDRMLLLLLFKKCLTEGLIILQSKEEEEKIP